MLESITSKSLFIGNFCDGPICEHWSKIQSQHHKTVPNENKKFPMKRLLEMIDSSIKNPGEAEYDKQN
jgi:hypothetical protein